MNRSLYQVSPGNHFIGFRTGLARIHTACWLAFSTRCPFCNNLSEIKCLVYCAPFKNRKPGDTAAKANRDQTLVQFFFSDDAMCFTYHLLCVERKCLLYALCRSLPSLLWGERTWKRGCFLITIHELPLR